MNRENDTEHDGDYGEPGDEYRQGCSFPDRCLMPGMHNRSECHDVEMMEALHAELAPDTEHHWQDRPWATIGKVPCQERGVNGERNSYLSDTIVRLPNEEGQPRSVNLLVARPGDTAARNGTELQPEDARELAQFLVEAADWVDGGIEPAVFTRLDHMRYTFDCDNESWILTVHDSANADIEHEVHGGGVDVNGWAVEMALVDGLWKIGTGAESLAENTRDTTPAALEALLNLHGVPA